MINGLYRCQKITRDPTKYGLATAHLQRIDGYAGWLTLSGPEVERFVVSRAYMIDITEAETDVTPATEGPKT